MQCVYFGSEVPDEFEEQIVFSAQMPYVINIKKFPEEDIVPLHYAETVELLLCDGLCGEIVIDNQHYPLEGCQLFVIPPFTVHANSIRPGTGTMYVLKICFRELDRYLNIANFLELSGTNPGQLRYLCPEYPAVKEVVDGLVRCDGDLPRCLPLILRLFAILSAHVDPNRSSAGGNTQLKSASLQELIRWTNENFNRKITIDEAAAMTGYSKFHFCSRFKALTGMTYMNYLNSVRISRACLMLRNGDAVQTVGRSCGYENSSHFIQIFKRIRHMTPYQYASQQRRELRQEEKS